MPRTLKLTGHSFDEKVGNPGWAKLAGSCDRSNRLRDFGMLGVSPAKRLDGARVDGLGRRSIDLGIKAHLPTGVRLMPGNAAEWTAPRSDCLGSSSSAFGSSASDIAPSVISSCPSTSAMTNDVVEAMVKTITDQESEMRFLQKQIMELISEVDAATTKEGKLRDFIERCSSATQTIWAENNAMEERNITLKRRLDALERRNMN